ncbi:MAG: DeoR family transcriptional regulator [Lentisphaerae bacterium]|nr:DeoR family transcriptional regulator [Lentisphaerota bacterium]
MNPVIASYISAPPDLAAAVKPAASDSPLLAALVHLHEAIRGKQAAARGLRAAREVGLRDEDNDLCVLFLVTWAQAAGLHALATHTGMQQAWTVLHRARAMLAPATPPELGAGILVVESLLQGGAGNHADEERLLREALAALPAASPHRPDACLRLARLLAELGRLGDLEPGLGAIPAPSRPPSVPGGARAPCAPEGEQAPGAPGVSPAALDAPPGLPRSIILINAMETGRTDLAARLLAESGGAASAPAEQRLVARYRVLLGLMTADAEQRAAAVGTDRERAVSAADLPDWALVMQCLLSAHIHQALRWARLCEKRGPSSLAGHDCVSLNLIRAELAEGNAEAADRLLNMRRDLGNANYWDNLFLARIALLAGQAATATARFAALLRAVDLYGAAGRLRFELRLAAEMPRDALVDLTRGAHAILRAEAAPGRAKAGPPFSAAGAGLTAPPSPAAAPPATFAAAADAILGRSEAIARVREAVARFAPLDVPVLITGETGTGKELAARALHDGSRRRDEPFLAVNCGAIPVSILESELFGHAKGAFTGAAAAHAGLFEEAGRGTLLLDEIGDIPAPLQAALLRVLETGEIRPVGSARSKAVACRILASTNADLDRLVAERRFRQDILYRLRRLRIHLPPLRDRGEDVLLLAAHFLNAGRPPDTRAAMSTDLTRRLLRHAWPGNVRELRNAVERMRLMNSDKLWYDAADIDLPADGALEGTETPPAGASAESPPAAARSPAATRRPIRLTPAHRVSRRAAGRRAPRVRRLEALRELFRGNRLLTRAEIIEHAGVSPNTATRDLQDLVEEGFVERVSPSASPRSVYFVRREAPSV